MDQGLRERVMRCWGKTGKAEEGAEVFHPAVFHMIDVGNVAKALIGGEASPRWGKALAEALDADPARLTEWLPWAVAMHDIGKISAPFQGQNQDQAERMRAEGFRLLGGIDLRHPVIGQIALQIEKQDGQPMTLRMRTVLSEMAGGHHGLFQAPGEAREGQRRLRRDEPSEWAGLRGAAADLLAETFLPEGFDAWPEPENISTAILALTGFTILCDWIGSNGVYFRPCPGMLPEAYQAHSLACAVEGVRLAGFTQPGRSEAPVEFSRLFPGLAAPRPLQTAIDRIPDELLRRPCLAILEAPTGEGKTEAALALAHRIGALRGSDEFFYALPTAATSNQMHGRLQRYLRERLGLPSQVKLVHSQAFLLEDQVEVEPLNDGDGEAEGSVSLEWFSSKKRALLAPYGVGTIDQAELGALNVSHNALRLTGLAGKTLILDEVHAYDTYMTTIIERLLEWLAALGTSVILLSATLPRARRERLAKAYGVMPTDSTRADGYPCVWVGNRQEEYCDTPPAAQPDRPLHVRLLHVPEDSPAEKARWLLEQVGERGCACWITNTVGRAQAIFQALEALVPADVERLLIHSRFPLDPIDPEFPLSGREAKERWLTERLGPQGKRPQKLIVIGTQVLEQSLDLDFDVMVSDLAPIDLLLQRAGRLHRHARKAEERGAHTHPTLWIYHHQTADGSLDLSSDRAIYAEYFLRRTWEALEGKTELRLPAGYRPLIEAVYDADPPSGPGKLAEAWKRLQREEIEDSQEARLRLIAPPRAGMPFCAATGRMTFEEDEDRAGWIVARTRLGEESVTAIPVTWNGAGYGGEIPLDRPAERAEQLRLLRAGIKVSGNELAGALRAAASPLPALFKKSALLKNALPLQMEDGQAEVTGQNSVFHLELDPSLGLLVARQKGKEHD